MAKQQKQSVQIPIWSTRESGATSSAAADGGAASAAAAAAARISQVAPSVAGSTAPPTHPLNLAGKIAKIIFLAHLAGLAVLVAYLSIRGFLSHHHAPRFAHYHPPLFTSAAAASIASLAFLHLTARRPHSALVASLYLSPFLTFLLAFLLLSIGTALALALAVLTLVLALTLSLYACWIAPRLPHATRVLSAALPSARPDASVLAASSAGIACAAVWTLGAGGVAADPPRLPAIYVIALLLSLSWTMHVIRNLVHVSVAHVAHAWITCQSKVGVWEALRTVPLGSVCVGSAVAPPVTAVRGAARAMGVVAGDSDEFLFSCASCFAGVADRVVARANRWGFVHVGVYRKEFGKASSDTWEMFEGRGMVRLIDADITGSFCFMTGVAGGALASLVAGPWVIAVDKGHVTGVTVYAFLFGYFITRIAMVWAQACVSAYHVAYAEDPINRCLDSAIPDQMRELQLSPD